MRKRIFISLLSIHQSAIYAQNKGYSYLGVLGGGGVLSSTDFSQLGSAFPPVGPAIAVNAFGSSQSHD